MTIYILDLNPSVCAQMLDDRSLDRMIKDIAQVLCNVHYMELVSKDVKDKERYGRIPMFCSDYLMCEWSRWTRKFKANYLWLIELGSVCCSEWLHRFGRGDYVIQGEGIGALIKGEVKWEWYVGHHEINEVIKWASENIPNLPDKDDQALFFGITETIDTYGKPSYLPLVMPKKYLIFKSKGFEEPTPWIENSYRNYYKEKIKKRIEKCQGCTYESKHKVSDPYCDVAQWTRREKPTWLNLEAL